MTNVAVDLWPTDFGETEALPPVTILRQQATLLGNKTKNLIEGQVKSTSYSRSSLAATIGTRQQSGGFGGGGFGGSITSTDQTDISIFRHNFELVAPALGGYRYRLFYIEHEIAMYPVGIFYKDERVECQTEQEFIERLREILSSDDTRHIITALIAQSKA